MQNGPQHNYSISLPKRRVANLINSLCQANLRTSSPEKLAPQRNSSRPLPFSQLCLFGNMWEPVSARMCSDDQTPFSGSFACFFFSPTWMASCCSLSFVYPFGLQLGHQKLNAGPTPFFSFSNTLSLPSFFSFRQLKGVACFNRFGCIFLEIPNMSWFRIRCFSNVTPTKHGADPASEKVEPPIPTQWAPAPRPAPRRPRAAFGAPAGRSTWLSSSRLGRAAW